MKRNIYILSLVILIVSNNAFSQFGIENRIKDKYKKMGLKHAEKQLDKAEDKGMEEAEKGLDKASDSIVPNINKVEENKEKGEEYIGIGLGKYQEFVDNYEGTVYSKNSEDYRRYSFESAIVVYSLNDSDKDRKEVYIDGGGYKYSEYQFKTSKEEMQKTGQILIGSKMISLDYENSTAVEMNNPVAAFLANPDKDWEASAKIILEKMGYEMIGNETILDRDCEIWKQGNHRIWVWNGLTLKSKMGKTTEEATDFKINTEVDDSKFNIPEGFEINVIDEQSIFPNVSDLNEDEEIYEDDMTEEEWNQLLDKVEDMSWSEYKTMVLQEDPDTDIEELKQYYLYLRQASKRRNN